MILTVILLHTSLQHLHLHPMCLHLLQLPRLLQHLHLRLHLVPDLAALGSSLTDSARLSVTSLSVDMILIVMLHLPRLTTPTCHLTSLLTIPTESQTTILVTRTHPVVAPGSSNQFLTQQANPQNLANPRWPQRH